ALIRRPAVGFLGAWCFITLTPTSRVVPIATEGGAERRRYLRLIALVVLGVVGAYMLWRRLLHAWPTPLAGARHRTAVLTGTLVLLVVSLALSGITHHTHREL